MSPSRSPSPAQVRARAARLRRRPTLGLEAIVDVALEIVDAEGVEAVSMRRVAAAFDSGPASLYAYVANKDALLGHVLRRVIDEMELPSGGTWQERLRSWAYESRAVMARHGDVARLTFGTVPVTERVLDGIETNLTAMIEAGVPPQVATWALDILSLYVGADVFEGWLMSQRFDDGSGRDAEEIGSEYFEAVQREFAALPPERYPYLVRHLPLMMNGDSDARFAFGIDMLIAGFAAQIPAPS
ncbi:TetR/AcrR family transcriptional regulator C-terminal domain-containing protein [Nocardioides sp. 503]|uniref:TetR/AcrR family transcriptional regulator C-terminal domain-containing protein n=1 Tax=Nocardioides sp. 503 TaxID=2508326 RepID=UPI00142F7548|nr:TetR/AcrR family transcriptional regulator C-terminal domain-containing protein [Nocardioides sp. 503]